MKSNFVCAIIIAFTAAGAVHAKSPKILPANGKATLIIEIDGVRTFSRTDAERLVEASPKMTIPKGDPRYPKAFAAMTENTEAFLKANEVNFALRLQGIWHTKSGAKTDTFFFYGEDLITDPKTGRRWAVTQIKPGDIYMVSFGVQDLWRACFNAETKAFKAQAGDILYVGRLDARANRALIENAVNDGRLGGTIYKTPQQNIDIALLHQSLQAFTPATDSDLANATEFARSQAGQGIAIRRAETVAVTFPLEINSRTGQEYCYIPLQDMPSLQ